MIKFLAVAIAAGICLCASETSRGENAKAVFTVEREGLLKVEGIPLPFFHATKDWKTSQQGMGQVKGEGVPERDVSSGSLTFNGVLACQSADFPFKESLSRLGGGPLDAEYALSGVSQANSAAAGLQVRLPVQDFSSLALVVDGKAFALPKDPPAPGKGFGVIPARICKTLEIPLKNGRLSIKGDFQLYVQDDRVFNHDDFVVRILAELPKTAGDAMLKLRLAMTPYAFQAVDISKAVNMGFQDDVGEDHAGGWTDQGPENDLRMLPTGAQTFSGVKFSVIDPKANGGKSCLAFAAPQRPYFLKKAEAPAAGEFKSLYLLHAVAWDGVEEVGSIDVNYADGSSKTVKVGPSDVGNWWLPVARSNGKVAWTGENKSAYVGLFLSRYDIDAKPLRSLVFKTAGNSVWMVAAASLSNDVVPQPDAMPTYIVAGRDWKPVALRQDVEKGGALDFSFLLDAPAGKRGPLIVNKEGKFAFAGEPAKPVRFYGVNLVGLANFLDKPLCDRLADRLAMSGYNAVRFHHHDNVIAKHEGSSSVALNPASMDQLDYLFACLKKRGIYVTTDLLVSRRLQKGEIPEFPDEAIDGQTLKTLAFFLDSAMANWEAFARSFLTHVNPYTGVAVKDDPALAGLSLINESTLVSIASDPKAAKIVEGAFAKWLAEKNEPKLYGRELELQRVRFLLEAYDKGYARMRAFVRGLGCEIPLTDQNMCSSPILARARSNYDYVDDHFYWDHPRFVETSWQMPSAFENRSAISDVGGTLAVAMPSRVFGKPFAATEFDFAFPNDFNGEAGPLVGAYASLQGWDALYRFAYSHRRDHILGTKLANIPYFDVAVNPVKSLSDRIAMLLFLRGDIETAKDAYPTLTSKSVAIDGKDGLQWRDYYPKDVASLGLVSRVGSVAEDDSFKIPEGAKALNCLESSLLERKFGLPLFLSGRKEDFRARMISQGVLDRSHVDLENGVFKSSTGELELNAKRGFFKAASPRSEVFVMREGDSAKGRALSAEARKSFAVVCASSVDGLNLAESKRILILHLTECLYTKTKFKSCGKVSTLESYGELPCLVKGGELAITLKLNSAKRKLYGLDMAGKRIAEMKFEEEDGGVSFLAKTFAEGGPFLAYELVCE